MGRNGITTLAILAVAFSGAAWVAGADDIPDASLVARPEVVQFGGHFNDVLRSVASLCVVGVIERSNQPIVLPTAKERQTQIDCIGLDYAGKPRKAYFQFADDILDVVVIETGADEEQALRKLLIEKYGKPSQAGKGETVFLEKGVALRTGPHSVVFFSDRLKGRYGSF